MSYKQPLAPTAPPAEAVVVTVEPPSGRGWCADMGSLECDPEKSVVSTQDCPMVGGVDEDEASFEVAMYSAERLRLSTALTSRRGSSCA